MRKKDPNRAIDTFQAEISASLADLTALHVKVGSSGPLARRASLDAFVRAAVAFERFRSDWHIAAINQDASRFNITQVNRITSQFDTQKGRPLLEYVNITVPTIHPSLEQIARLVDVEDGNLSIRSADDWDNLAGKHLVDPWRSKVGAVKSSSQDKQFFDAVIAVRNVAAHQSGRATGVLNTQLARMRSGRNKAFGRPERGVTASNLSTYLNAKVDGKLRVELFHTRLHALAELLREP